MRRALSRRRVKGPSKVAVLSDRPTLLPSSGADLPASSVRTVRVSKAHGPSAAPSQLLLLGSRSPLSVSRQGRGRPSLQSQTPQPPQPSQCPNSKRNDVFSTKERQGLGATGAVPSRRASGEQPLPVIHPPLKPLWKAAKV